jgi:transcriptional regulator with XRE-family HTH domain
MYEDYFAKQLRAYRESRDLTLQELADILHTSKQVLSRYETGQRIPKISVANEYAAILDLPLSYFMPNPPHWTEDVWEDWQRARSDQERYAIIREFGLDPRGYPRFLEMKAEEASPVPPFRVSDHEREVILAYRSRPEMRAAVDRLLELPASAAPAVKWAARGQRVPQDGPMDENEVERAISQTPSE